MENPLLFSIKLKEFIIFFDKITDKLNYKRGKMTKKEKTDRIVQFVVRPSLYAQFEEICEDEQKTISVVLRELMLSKIRENEKFPS